MNTAVATMPKPEAIAHALEQVKAGRSLRDIAGSLGISHESIRAWMLSSDADKYQKAKEMGLVGRIIDADRSLDEAKDHLDIARARERARFARFDIERLLSHRWSQKQEVSGTITVEVDDKESGRRLAFLMAQSVAVDAVIVADQDADKDEAIPQPVVSEPSDLIP